MTPTPDRILGLKTMREEKVEHTPGPWRVYDNEQGCGVSPVDPDANDVAACVGGIYRDRVEARANARLIAAAPSMLPFVERAASAGDPEAIKIMETVRGHA